ncbi:MAG: undecaprenyl-phosphate glucose phosphotransferase [Gammaproteobacteria bacterium]
MQPRRALKELYGLLCWSVRVIDVLLLVLAGYLAFALRFHHFDLTPRYLNALYISAFVGLVCFQQFEVYASFRGRSFLAYLFQITWALAIVMLVMLTIGFASRTSAAYSRFWLASWFAIAWVLLSLFRAITWFVLRWSRGRGLNVRNVVIIGNTDIAKKMANDMHQALWTGFRVVAILDEEVLASEIRGVPVKTMPEDLPEYIARENIQEVWIALPLRQEERIKQITHALRHNVITTRYMLDLFSQNMMSHSMTEILGVPMMNLCATSLYGVNHIVKNIFDRLFAAFVLLLISPIMLVIAIAVKCSSSGPVFYRQTRMSIQGQPFEMLKFRSMPVDAEKKTGAVWASKEDNRATRVGQFLRKTSLDELPQFINVLKGDMSIVGPRPERPELVDKFKNEIPGYMQKHLVKAGITGWAQINGWRGNTCLEQRIKHDLFYIENWSLWFDLKIIALTVFKGFMNKNAY